MRQYMINYDSVPGPLRFLVGDVINRSRMAAMADRIVVQFGRLDFEFPRNSVISTEQIGNPRRIRIGWRKNRERTLSLVASRCPVVRMRLDPPGSFRMFGMTFGVDVFEVALDDAIGLVSEMKRRSDVSIEVGWYDR